MPEYTYDAVAYRQSQDPTAPWLVSFVVTAEELLEWAGIPRRSETGVIGFQRAYDDERVGRAKEFFNLGVNQSPTALVVGLHPSTNSDSSVTLTFRDGDQHATIRRCVLRVSHAEEMSAQQAAAIVKHKLDLRLQHEEKESDSVSSNDIELPPEDNDDESNFGDESQEEGQGVDEIEIGKSMIATLRARLDDPEWCSVNADALLDLAKPATIIDGQHRVKGAELCERNIPFAVCALFECSWPEQVFQFTVVNYTSKGIPDQFITANAALSLTERELKTLERRLVQARVKVIEYEIMKVVQFDANSPFYNLVNLSDKKDPSRIGYKTMVRLARAWYSPTRPFFKLMFAGLYPNQRKHSDRVKEWKMGDWGEFFIAFWSAIKAHYETHPSHESGHTLWDIGHSNLIISVVLLQLQEALFDNLEQQDEEFWEVPAKNDPSEYFLSKVVKRVEKNLAYFPPEFFGTTWKTKSLNTSLGRQALSDAFENLTKKKGSYQYARSALVTGKTNS